MRLMAVHVSKAPRLTKGEVWERGHDEGQEDRRRTNPIQGEHARTALESAGSQNKRTEECLFRRRRLGDTPAHGGWAGGHGGGAARKDVVQPICTPGSKPLNEGVKPGSGMWKTASGEPSEEQGGREGKRVTERVWPGWWQRGSSRALASGRR